jgi:hypothetical protein
MYERLIKAARARKMPQEKGESDDAYRLRMKAAQQQLDQARRRHARGQYNEDYVGKHRKAKRKKGEK